MIPSLHALHILSSLSSFWLFSKQIYTDQQFLQGDRNQCGVRVTSYHFCVLRTSCVCVLGFVYVFPSRFSPLPKHITIKVFLWVFPLEGEGRCLLNFFYCSWPPALESVYLSFLLLLWTSLSHLCFCTFGAVLLWGSLPHCVNVPNVSKTLWHTQQAFIH